MSSNVVRGILIREIQFDTHFSQLMALVKVAPNGAEIGMFPRTRYVATLGSILARTPWRSPIDRIGVPMCRILLGAAHKGAIQWLANHGLWSTPHERPPGSHQRRRSILGARLTKASTIEFAPQETPQSPVETLRDRPRGSRIPTSCSCSRSRTGATSSRRA